MNCQDINYLLDASLSDPISREQSESIRRHLASCRACSQEWENWAEMTNLAIPPTPATLLARITASLPSPTAQPARRSVRPVILGSFVVAGLAVAAAMALKTDQTERKQPPPVAEASPVSAPAAGDEVDPAPALALDANVMPAAEVAVAAAGGSTVGPLDPLTLIVLKRPEAAADARAVALAEQCHDAIVSQLHGIAGVKLLISATTKPQAASPYPLPLADQELARGAGAGSVLAISTENGCRVTLYNSATRIPIGGGMYGQRLLPSDGWYSYAGIMVDVIRDKLLNNAAGVASEAKTRLRNTQLSDFERIKALSELASAGNELGKEALQRTFDKETLAMAVHLGINTPDVDMRSAVWASLRNVTDPQMVQPLLQALTKDADATVRMQAAYSLRTYLEEPGVREALRRAAAEDADNQPSADCCLDTVREAAERASIPDAEFRNWVRNKLFDESLPARARLLALRNGTMDGRFISALSEIGADSGRVVFEIGRREQDPRVRQLAWGALQLASPDEGFVPVLLDDLKNHPDGYVRAAAAEVLTHHRSNPGVMEALEFALNDPSVDVRRIALRVTGRTSP